MTTLIHKLFEGSAKQGLMTTLMSFYSNNAKPILLPTIGIAVFLFLWSLTASSINTSLGKFPGPTAVATQMVNLYDEHVAEREKADAFYLRQEERNAKRIASDPSYVPKTRTYTGKETFLDQIITSLVTVMTGFLVLPLLLFH